MINFKSEESRKRCLDSLFLGSIVSAKNRKERTKNKKKIYDENPKLCKQCDGAILFEKKVNDFCSMNCSAIYNNVRRGKRIRKKEYFCNYCNKKLERHQYKYCSINCQQTLRHEESIKNIENNIITSTSFLRKYLMIKYDNKCQKCGWGILNPMSGTVCLDMHHKDGDYKNNILSNVEILCPNCHSLTNTYKRVNRNRKSTRVDRKII